MFAVLYVLALVMVAGGAWAIFAGWELLLLERGWSMVIAGATLATGGLVLAGATAAAQALARRLDALAEAVRAAARAQAPAFPKRPTAAEGTAAPVAPPPQPPAREIEPKVPPKAPPREPVAPAGPAPVAALGLGGVAAEAVAPGAMQAPPEPEGGLPPLDIASTTQDDGARPAEEETQPPLEETRAEPPSEEAVADEAAEPEPAPVETIPVEAEETPAVAATEPVPGAAAVAGPGIEEPVLGRRERGRIEAEAQALSRRLEESALGFGAPSAPTPSPGEEGEPDETLDQLAAASAEPPPPRVPSRALEEAAGEARAQADDEAAPADAPRPEDAPLGESPEAAGAERPEPPVVVGTHVSGANRYVMYSDGSIEAETPEGRLVFGSIDELKGYIASAGQDPTGASQTGPR
jgi:hypothetical protein